MAGRPKGWKTCTYRDPNTGKTCQRLARVRVRIGINKGTSGAYKKGELLRCLEHYVDTEELARSRENFEVIEATLYEPEEEEEEA